MKYYVLADLHGFYTPMCKALEEAGFFAEKEPHRLVVCGDMMDRGSEALAMQSFMLKQLEAERLIFVRGNHEDLLEAMIFDIALGRPVSGNHEVNGTFDTAVQLSGIDPQLAPRYRMEVAARTRESDFMRRLLPAAVDYFETPHYVFVHGYIPGYAEVPEDIPLDGSLHCRPDWREADAIAWRQARWQNGMECACIARYGVPGKTVVCGHWNASFGHAALEKRGSEYGDDADHSPFFGQGIIALDACTAHSGRVNCLVIED